MVPSHSAAVAASGSWIDDEGIRMPSGDVHAWQPSTNQTLCGIPLARAGLSRFPHVGWIDVTPTARPAAPDLGWICPRCDAAVMGRRNRGWTRIDPRP